MRFNSFDYALDTSRSSKELATLYLCHVADNKDRVLSLPSSWIGFWVG